MHDILGQSSKEALGAAAPHAIIAQMRLFGGIATMKTKLLPVTSLMLGALCAFGEPIEGDFAKITIGTNTFTNAHLRAYSPSEGSLAHDGGIEKIKLADLPEPARSKFYDPQKEQEAIGAKERGDSERKAAAEWRRLAETERYQEANFRLIDGKVVNAKNWPELDGRIIIVLTNGVLLQLAKTVRVYDPIRPLPSAEDRVGLFNSAPFVPPEHYTQKRQLTDEIVFVAFNPTNSYDGEELTVSALRAGTIEIKGRTYQSYRTGKPYKSDLLKSSVSP